MRLLDTVDGIPVPVAGNLAIVAVTVAKETCIEMEEEEDQL